MKVIDPFLDGEGVWQGDSPGTMRKRFQCFGIKNSVDFCSNVTVYAPGEGSVFHNHPSSEELSYVISGSGVIQDMEQNVKAHIDQGKLILIDRGEIHRIFNDGRAPLIVLLVCIQIFCRFVLNNSLTWSEELARFMFIWSTFLSIGFCLKEGISLKIDTLISLFPKKVQAVILLLGDVVMTVFFLYLLPSAWEFAYASVENGQTSAACGIPMYFVQGSLMVGFALAAFRAAQGVWSNLRTLLQKGDE